ncbi:uncharacterized protein AC631_01361 [Debaryomyces fabryi]|uniref:Uracil-DNA glycosylase-like domain-containing protein n=1 Tax=Debaryomyces fabryi TaxID=58627 RepID=A0A0V1Q2Y2_9ASCO|nr:uncharacterized protein AC631_01361 [Debaryomyces fabryi]KSA02881.1 hypothetical protein AC631_01361 [Debaryomyces fabryi]CUM45045.1 unnamed protein product [Debaryomyces fabryi]
MDRSTNLKSIINSFKYDDGKPIVKKTDKVSKTTKANLESSKLKDYEDLQPSLDDNLKLLFIGFNPGVQSSIQQHHYAHFTNLFWKLFNESGLLINVLQSLKTPIEDVVKEDPLLKELVKPISDKKYKTFVKPVHDFEIVKYKIGFTDLVLRCTKTAQELTLSEKLDNVPRLFREFQESRSTFIVFVGKGIWEIIVKYITNLLKTKIKLTKDNFHWGKQMPGEDVTYNMILEKLNDMFGYRHNIYVFPNTSGLVTSLKYDEKLQLWNDLSQEILNS